MTREEAINKVRQMSLPKEMMDILEALAPELAESEDERIRMALIKLMTVAGENYVMSATGFEKERLLAYLEKQKEQKPAEWSKGDENALENIHELISFGYSENFMDAQTAHDMRKWVNEHLCPDTFQNGSSQWKPSEEQMAMLLAVINEPNNAMAESCQLALKSLYEHFKKLM